MAYISEHDLKTLRERIATLEAQLEESEKELQDSMIILGKALYPEADFTIGEVRELARDVVAQLEAEKLAHKRTSRQANEAIEIANASCAAAEAKVDALMLEYCPGEMTPKQIKR